MITKIQDNIVKESVASLEARLDRISINIEIDDVDGEMVLSEEAIYYLDGEEDQYDLTLEATDLFEDLRDAMAKREGQTHWVMCDLQIEKDGEYKFSFSHESSPRLQMLRDA